MSESVDTEQAETYKLGLPAVVAMPTESAVKVRAFAEQVLEAVRLWAPIGIDVEEADEARRRLAIWADMVRQLDLGPDARLDLVEAQRIAERVQGRQARRYEAAGETPDVEVPSVCYLWASFDDETWQRGLDIVRVARTPSASDLSASLTSEDGALAEIRRFRITGLAAQGASSTAIAAQVGIPADDVVKWAAEWGLDLPGDLPPRPEKPANVQEYLDALVADLFDLAARADVIESGDLGSLDRTRLRDTVTKIWDAAAPVILLRGRIERHLRQ